MEVRYFARVVVQDDRDDLYGDLVNPPQYCLIDVTLVTLYSHPHPRLFEDSYGALISSRKLGKESLRVIEITAIRSVVGMVLHCVQLQEGGMQDRFFLVQKMGMELTYSGAEYDNDEDN